MNFDSIALSKILGRDEHNLNSFWEEICSFYTDKTILITADISAKIERIKKRDKLNEIEINNRMNTQIMDEIKIKLADFVIENNDNKLLLPQLIICVNQL